MSLQRPKFLLCPDCKKRFESIRDLNDHIEKTGCHQRRKLKIILDRSGRPALSFISLN